MSTTPQNRNRNTRESRQTGANSHQIVEGIAKEVIRETIIPNVFSPERRRTTPRRPPMLDGHQREDYSDKFPELMQNQNPAVAAGNASSTPPHKLTNNDLDTAQPNRSKSSPLSGPSRNSANVGGFLEPMPTELSRALSAQLNLITPDTAPANDIDASLPINVGNALGDSTAQKLVAESHLDTIDALNAFKMNPHNAAATIVHKKRLDLAAAQQRSTNDTIKSKQHKSGGRQSPINSNTNSNATSPPTKKPTQQSSDNSGDKKKKKNSGALASGNEESSNKKRKKSRTSSSGSSAAADSNSPSQQATNTSMSTSPTAAHQVVATNSTSHEPPDTNPTLKNAGNDSNKSKKEESKKSKHKSGSGSDKKDRSGGDKNTSTSSSSRDKDKDVDYDKFADGFPRKYEVLIQARVRLGRSLESPHITDLPEGTTVTVAEIQENRARIVRPLHGWCSVLSQYNGKILLPLDGHFSKVGHSIMFRDNENRERQITGKIIDYDEKQKKYRVRLDNGDERYVDPQSSHIRIFSDPIPRAKPAKTLQPDAPVFDPKYSKTNNMAVFQYVFTKDYPAALQEARERAQEAAQHAVAAQAAANAHMVHQLAAAARPHHGAPGDGRGTSPHMHGYPPDGAPPHPHGAQYMHRSGAPPGAAGPSAGGPWGALPRGVRGGTSPDPGMPPMENGSPHRLSPNAPPTNIRGASPGTSPLEQGGMPPHGVPQGLAPPNHPSSSHTHHSSRHTAHHPHGYPPGTGPPLPPHMMRVAQPSKGAPVPPHGSRGPTPTHHREGYGWTPDGQPHDPSRRERTTSSHASPHKGIPKPPPLLPPNHPKILQTTANLSREEKREWYEKYQRHVARQHQHYKQQLIQYQKEAAANAIPRQHTTRPQQPSSSSRTRVKGLIVLRGLPGSGKTTLAKKLAARSPNARICTEDRYHWSGGQDGQGEYRFKPELVFLAREWCTKEIRKCIKQQVSLIILDNHNARISMYEDHIHYAVKYGYRFRIIEFVASEELIDRYRGRSYKRFPREVYQKLLKLWESDHRAELINPTFGDESSSSTTQPSNTQTSASAAAAAIAAAAAQQPPSSSDGQQPTSNRDERQSDKAPTQKSAADNNKHTTQPNEDKSNEAETQRLTDKQPPTIVTAPTQPQPPQSQQPSQKSMDAYAAAHSGAHSHPSSATHHTHSSSQSQPYPPQLEHVSQNTQGWYRNSGGGQTSPPHSTQSGGVVPPTAPPQPQQQQPTSQQQSSQQPPQSHSYSQYPSNRERGLPTHHPQQQQSPTSVNSRPPPPNVAQQSSLYASGGVPPARYGGGPPPPGYASASAAYGAPPHAGPQPYDMGPSPPHSHPISPPTQQQPPPQYRYTSPPNNPNMYR